MTILQLFITVGLLFLPFSGPVRAADSCLAVAIPGEQILRPDDLAGAGLEEAVAASLDFLGKIPGSRRYKFCDREYSAADLKAALDDFLRLWRQLGSTPEFYRQVAKRFEFLAVQQEQEEPGRILATGYFEPLVEGSLQRRPPFLYPIYRVPADLVNRDGRLGRVEGGRLLPYWSRAEIEDGQLLAGQELAFLDDPVAAFILQVQGSGRVRLPDGSIRRVQFGAKSGRPYRSIGRLLVDRGVMRLEEVNLPAIVAYLQAHPEQRREILQHNESFVFFRWGEDGQAGPLGNLGQPLTAERSVALDQEYYPPGALGLLQTRRPLFNARDEVVGWTPVQRLVFNQDTGSAIRGAGRLDLFLGHGNQARNTAGLLKTPGRLFLLMGKK